MRGARWKRRKRGSVANDSGRVPAADGFDAEDRRGSDRLDASHGAAWDEHNIAGGENRRLPVDDNLEESSYYGIRTIRRMNPWRHQDAMRIHQGKHVVAKRRELALQGPLGERSVAVLVPSNNSQGERGPSLSPGRVRTSGGEGHEGDGHAVRVAP
jgi:hypothetical protein